MRIEIRLNGLSHTLIPVIASRYCGKYTVPFCDGPPCIVKYAGLTLKLFSKITFIGFYEQALHCNASVHTIIIIIIINYFSNAHNTLQGMSLCAVRKKRLGGGTVQVHDIRDN